MTHRWVCSTPHCRTIDITVPNCPRCGFDQKRNSRDQCVLRNALFDGQTNSAVSEIRRMKGSGGFQSSTRMDPIECFEFANGPRLRPADCTMLEDENIPQELLGPVIELVKTGRYRGRAVNPSIWGHVPPIEYVKVLKFLHRNGVGIWLDQSGSRAQLPVGWMIYINYINFLNNRNNRNPYLDGVINLVEHLISIRAIDPMRHMPAFQWNDGIGAGLNDVMDREGVWCIARVNYATRWIHFLMYDPDCDEDLTPAAQIEPPYSMSRMPRGTTLSEMANGMMDNGRMAAGIARGLGVYYRNLTGLTERISPLLPFVPSLSKLVARYILG